MTNMNEIKAKITKLHEMNNEYLKEISSLLNEKKQSADLQMISYFTYSLSLAHESEGENFCLGTYHLFNITDQPITNPYICIKLTPSSLFSFSGKYLYKDSAHKMRFSNSWERINDPDDKEEYWLKPYNIEQLEPYQKISFSDFQIKWTATSTYSGSVLGYTYGDEINEGIHSLNQINIGGKVAKEEMDDESL